MKSQTWLWIYTGIHCIVDLACIYFLTGLMIPLIADHDKWLFFAVLYNALAFALPMLTGLLADFTEKNVLLACVGCFCVSCAFIMYRRLLFSVFLLGMGNGLFHIGGGKHVLCDSGKEYAPCGIFISSGALGVYLGSFWGRNYYPIRKIVFVSIVLCAAILWILRKKEAQTEQKRKMCTEYIWKHRGYYHMAFMVLMFVVCIRSYYGTILNYSWKSGFAVGLLFALCVVGGKFTGGILADRLGITPAIIVSLGIAGATAPGSFQSPVMGCVSVFFFNMTMPLTLSLMARLMPCRKGFAFGSLMFALFLGTIPSMVYEWDFLFTPQGLAAMCFISMVLLLWEVNTERKCIELS